MKLMFTEPNFEAYSDSSLTVFEVAEILERKYKIIKIFTNKYEEEIKQLLKQYYSKVKKAPKTSKATLEGSIQSLWIDYIDKEEHGIETQVSIKEGRKSFIRKGHYSNMLQVVSLE